jgi:anti-sigma regulatory factor (Ser/Thr protein kinase)
VNGSFLAELVLPGAERSVPVARRLVEQVLTAAGHQNVYGLLLVLSELVGNSVTHSVSGRPGGLVTVDVTDLGDGLARIDVIDQGSLNSAPKIQIPTEAEISGRGLAIVDELAVAWEACVDALGGTRVWAEVSTAEGAQEERRS